MSGLRRRRCPDCGVLYHVGQCHPCGHRTGAVPAPTTTPDAAAVVAMSGAIRDLAAAIAHLDRRLDAIAADVAMLRAMADAERQADGRAAYPQPAGWVR